MDSEATIMTAMANSEKPKRTVKDVLKAAGKKTSYYVLKRPKFCCCVPARWGVVLITFLSGAVSSVLMVSLWFEVASNDFAKESTRVIFVLLSLLETVSVIVSVLGFIGAFIRKLLFVLIYAGFLYFFFLLAFIVSLYVLGSITHVAHEDIVNICHANFISAGTQQQCTDLLEVTTGVLWGAAGLILAFNLYGAIVATRYVHQLRREKASLRQSRIMRNRKAYEKVYKRQLSPSDMMLFNVGDASPVPQGEGSFPLTDPNKAMSSMKMNPLIMSNFGSFGHDRNDSNASTAGLLEHAHHDSESQSMPMSYEEDGMFTPYADSFSSPSPRS